LVAEKTHNKNVTRISGLDLFKFNFEHLSNKFQLRFACAVSLHHHKDKHGDHTEVTVHGNFINEISDYLADECKIDRAFMNLNNKLGKKKKN